jgi:hypothetical protein
MIEFKAPERENEEAYIGRVAPSTSRPSECEVRTSPCVPEHRPVQASGRGHLAPALALVLALACSGSACSTTSHEASDGGHSGTDSTPVHDGALEAQASDGAAPLELTALSVSTKTSGVPAITLFPAFSPYIHDYYVQCASGTNDLVVSVTAASGAESTLVAPTKSPSLPTQTISLAVQEGQAIVAEATRGSAAVAYWVRCLPHDFPPMTWTPHPAVGSPSPGYYLVGNATVLVAQNGYAMILDGNGVPVWYAVEAERGALNVDDVVAGAVSFIGAPVVSSYEVHHLSPLATTYVGATGETSDEHELRALPGGDYLTFLKRQVMADLSGLVVPLPDGGTETLGPDDYVLDCDIAEVDGSGNILWQWYGTDHFDVVKDVTYFSFAPVGPGGGVVLDAFHCNSIDVDSSGNLLVSARNMDTVFYIEKSSGRVLWKLGGAAYSTDGATYLTANSPFFRQHDARFQTSWTSACSGGELSVFDDETGEPGPARAALYDVHIGATLGDGGTTDCGASDGGASGATLTWEYENKSAVEIMGSFRLEADGSRLIGWGSNGGLVFSEVDAKGQDLLDLSFTNGEASYRAVKVPLSAFDLDVLRSTAGK